MNRCLKISIIAILAVLFVNVASGAEIKTPLREKKQEKYTNIQLKGGVKIDQAKQLVTLSLRESDLRQVLRMLADKAGKNILMHDSVEGKISLDLVNVELNKVFEYIMTVKELSYSQDGNTIIVAGKEDAQALNLKMKQVTGIKIKNVDASRVAQFLNNNIFTANNPSRSSTPIITTNPSSNEILVFGNDDDVKLAREVAGYLDVKPNMHNFTVNFADPKALASKVCWTVFKSAGGLPTFTKAADQKEGSEISLVCGKTDDAADVSSTTTDTSSKSFKSSATALVNLTAFKTPSYWVLADTGLNQISIYGGTQEQLNMAAEVIKNYDKREPQVFMEISVIELSKSGSKALSNAWTALTNGNNLTFSTGTTQLGGNIINVIKDDHSGTTPYYLPTFTLGGDNVSNSLNGLKIYNAIQAIVTESKGRVLANPRIISSNNTKSNIKITSDYIAKTTITTDADTNERTIEYTTSSDAGLEFSVLPKISPNGYIALTIEPKFKTIKEQIKVDGEIVATLLNNRELTTKNVRVKDGETLVLAGLVQENETISHSKFPILADIPVIGALFQDQGTEKSRSELVIMVTPRIITDPDETSESL